MLYFIRHGQSQANASGVIAGQTNDSDLTAKGEEQSRAAAKEILAKGIKFDRIVASPMKRTRRTAEIIAEGIGFSIDRIEYDKRAMEYDPGDLVGFSADEITDEIWNQQHGEEDPSAFEKRVMTLVGELRQAGGTILLVSHADVAKMILEVDRHLKPELFYQIPEFRNAELIELH